MYDREISFEQSLGMPKIRGMMYMYRMHMLWAAELRRIWHKEIHSGCTNQQFINSKKEAADSMFSRALECKREVLELQSLMRQYRGDCYRVEKCWYDGERWHRELSGRGTVGCGP